MNTRGHLSRIAVLCALALSVATSAFAQATNYPEKAVMIISDAGAGSSPDVAMRIVADGLSKLWGQQAVVVNHPGANGSIAARAASEASSDGYTLYAPALSTFVALPTVAPNLPVKLPRDFLPIGFIAEQPMFLSVDPKSGITTLPDLIDRAKKAPGTLSIAVSGVGRMTHLTGLLLQQKAGIKLIPVPYTGVPRRRWPMWPAAASP
jgi:tripartite-type tricarboxylate transporter receptor subunit TctC